MKQIDNPNDIEIFAMLELHHCIPRNIYGMLYIYHLLEMLNAYVNNKVMTHMSICRLIQTIK